MSEWSETMKEDENKQNQILFSLFDSFTSYNRNYEDWNQNEAWRRR